MVPEGWYLVPNSAKIAEPGTKSSGTGTQPIGVGTNKMFCQLMFLEFFEQLLTVQTKFQLSGSDATSATCRCAIALSCKHRVVAVVVITSIISTSVVISERVQYNFAPKDNSNHYSLEWDWMKL